MLSFGAKADLPVGHYPRGGIAPLKHERALYSYIKNEKRQAEWSRSMETIVTIRAVIGWFSLFVNALVRPLTAIRFGEHGITQ